MTLYQVIETGCFFKIILTKIEITRTFSCKIWEKKKVNGTLSKCLEPSLAFL